MTVRERPYWVREPQQATMDRLHAIQAIVEAYDEQLTVRAITYKLYGESVHGKELENAYNRTSKDLVRARVLGIVPWSAISEERVKKGGGGGWANLEAYLDYHLDVDRLTDMFRRDRSPAHERPIQVWFEKATVMDYISEVCRDFGVKYVCPRGQMPWTAKKNAADALNPDTVILYFGDNDEKGREIRDVIDRDLHFLARKLGTEAPHIRWAGVTDQHESEYDLPRNARLDGVEPDDLRDMVRAAIREYVDLDTLNQIVATEEEQRAELRDTLREVLEN